MGLSSSLEPPLGIPSWGGLCQAGRGSVALGPCWVRVGGKCSLPTWLPQLFCPGEAAVPGLCRAGRGAGLGLWGLCSGMGLAAGPGSLLGFPACLCTPGAHRQQGETPATLQSQPGEAEAPSPGVSQP